MYHDIDKESIGGPPPNALDLVQRGTCKHKHGSPTRAKGVAHDLIRRKNGADAIHEPGVHGHGAIAAQPELGEMGKQGVTGVKINFEEVNWIEQG